MLDNRTRVIAIWKHDFDSPEIRREIILSPPSASERPAWKLEQMELLEIENREKFIECETPGMVAVFTNCRRGDGDKGGYYRVEKPDGEVLFAGPQALAASLGCRTVVDAHMGRLW